MATLPQLTAAEYNNIARIDDVEHATWLLTKLEADLAYFQEYLDRMARRYDEGVPQALCDQVGQLGEDLFDHLRSVDPAYQAEMDRRAAQELDDVYYLHHGYAADSIQGGHC